MIYNQCLILVKKIVTTPVVDVILILKTILRKKAIYLFIISRWVLPCHFSLVSNSGTQAILLPQSSEFLAAAGRCCNIACPLTWTFACVQVGFVDSVPVPGQENECMSSCAPLALVTFCFTPLLEGKFAHSHIQRSGDTSFSCLQYEGCRRIFLSH